MTSGPRSQGKLAWTGKVESLKVGSADPGGGGVRKSRSESVSEASNAGGGQELSEEVAPCAPAGATVSGSESKGLPQPGHLST